MSTQLYTQVEVYLDGKKLTEATNVKLTRTTKAQLVETMARGFAGMSPGAKMVSINVENAVPAADFELDPGEYMEGLRVAELTLFAAGRTLTSKGFITDDGLSGATNSPSGLSFDFVGEFAKWE